MARTGEQFAPELQAMKALFQDYTRRNEPDIVAHVERDIEQILEVCSSREEDARTVVKGASPGRRAKGCILSRLTGPCPGRF
jgi:hypothetical protein